MVNQLPIDVVPGTNPPRFRWQQTVSTPVGKQTVDHEGNLSPTVEGAVARLIALARQLQHDNEVLRDSMSKQSLQRPEHVVKKSRG